MTSTDTLIRAELVSFARDPGDGNLPQPGSLEHYGDGLLWLKEGHIKRLGTMPTSLTSYHQIAKCSIIAAD